MKNEKFCFNRNTGLIALVGIVLVGFVILSQSLIKDTKPSTNSRADVTSRQPAKRGGGTFTSFPVAGAGKISMAGLQQNVSDYLTNKLNIALTRTATLNTTKLTQLKGALTAELANANLLFSNLAGTVNPDTGTVPTTGIVTAQTQVVDGYVQGVSTKKLAADGDLTAAGKALTAAKSDWDAAVKAETNAQGAVDGQQPVYSLQAFPPFSASVNTLIAKLKFDALASVPLAQSLTSELASLKTTQLNPSGTDLKVGITNFNSFIAFYNKITTPNVQTNGASSVDLLKTNLNSVNAKALVDAVANFKVTLDKVVQAKTTLDTYQANLDTARATVRAKRDLYDAANQANDKAANIDAVYVELLSKITAGENALKGLNIQANNALPAGPQPLLPLVTPNTFSVDVSAYTSVQTALDVVNKALTDVNTSFDAVNTAMANADTEIASGVSNYSQYCANITSPDPSLKFYSLLDANGLPAGFAQNYYNNHCAQNKNDVKWNGKYGDSAKCYTATGLCTSVEGAHSESQILNLNAVTACVYQETDRTTCANAVPALKANDNMTAADCTGNAYFMYKNDYYKVGSQLMTAANGKKYCGNAKVDSTNTTDYAAAQAYVKNLVNGLSANATYEQRDLACRSNNWTFGPGPKGAHTAYSLPVAQVTKNASGQGYTVAYTNINSSDMCYQLKGMANPDGRDCLNKPMPDPKLCQCYEAQMNREKDPNGALTQVIYNASTDTFTCSNSLLNN